MRRITPHLLAAALLAATLSACGGSDDGGGGSSAADVAPGTGKTVHWGTSTIPTSLDPAVSNATQTVYLGLVFDRLVDPDPEGNLEPGLATKWTIADDAKSLDFTLRDGVKFQDGTPFNAAAVVANIEHYKSKDSLLSGSLGLIDKVEAVDESHVRFITNRPGGDLPTVLSGFAGMMLSPASLKAGTAGTKPVGAGPFTVSKITDSAVSFAYWDGYWAADKIVPKAVEVSIFTDDAARLNALKSGQLDAAIIRPNQVAEGKAAGLKTYSEEAPTAYGVSVNAAKPGLSNPDVRRALSNAIDREQISKFLFDGKCRVSAQPYPPDNLAYSKAIDEAPYVANDPAKARAAIEKASPGGLSLTILTPNVTAYQRLSEVLQEQLAKVGVKAKIEAVDYADLLARARAGDYDLIVTLLISASPDASTWAEQNYKVAPASTEFIDPALPKLIAASRTSIDPDVRSKAIGQITAKALEAGTNQIVVCLPSNTFASKAGVTGFEVNDPRTMNVP